MQPGEQIGMESVDFQDHKHLIVPSLQRMRAGNIMPSKPTALVHVNIIPMDEECVLGDQTMIVQDGRIQQIGAASSTEIPAEARRIDSTGKYLIPALADMHIHLEGSAWNIMFPPESYYSNDDLDFEKILFPYLANGIATAQVMSALPEHIPLRDRINRGEVAGPRLILNRMIDGPGQTWPPPINTWVETPSEARQAVLEAEQAGYDGMKVYSFLSPECYHAILTTAQEISMPVSGHIPDALSVEEIIAAGQNLIAHSEEVMKRAQENYDPQQIDYFAGIIASSDTWVTPTLTTSRKILAIFDDLQGELSKPEIRTLHPMALGVWSYLTENIYLKIPPEHHQAIREGFESFQLPFTKALQDKSVKLMTGTDALIPTNIPGFSIHDELVELVGTGLTPYEALKASTTHPMEYLGELDDAGSIDIGKRADLVLLEANPLEDISSTRLIDGVMIWGRWYTRSDLDMRLEEVALANMKR